MERVGAVELGDGERWVSHELVCSCCIGKDLAFGRGTGCRGLGAESFGLDETRWDRSGCLRRGSSGTRGLGSSFNVSGGDCEVNLELACSSVAV